VEKKKKTLKNFKKPSNLKIINLINLRIVIYKIETIVYILFFRMES